MNSRIAKFKTNKFLVHALEYVSRVTDDTEIMAIDMTDVFWDELPKMALNGEIINININGTPGKGKSTVGMAIGKVLTKELFKREFNIHDIDRDQEEFMETIKDPNLKQTVRVVDEWNELENTGENVTVINAFFTYVSDVMAQRFIHKISCSPSDSPDKNAEIYLEVVQPDKGKKVTHCRLLYKFLKGGEVMLQLLGYVNVDVSDVIDEGWYKEYRRRKFEKMDLILKEGIMRPREMKYAKLILEVVDSMKNLTRLGLLDKEIVLSYVENKFREYKMPTSMVGTELCTRRVSGILKQYKALFKIMKEIQINDTKFEKGKIDEGMHEIVKQQLDVSLNSITRALKNIEDSYNKMVEVKEKYDTVQDMS